MALPTKDQQTEGSSASDAPDNDNTSEGTSTSKTPKTETSTFDVIMDAIGSKEDGEGEDDVESEGKDDPANAEADKSKDDKAEGKEGESDEPGADELKAWKPKTRERFEKLQAKYRDVSERLEKAETEAGLYRQFTDFLDTNGVTRDQANELFNIGALMKNDPFKALELITPHYNSLLEITGNILPPDLVQQVNAGYMTQAAAVEVSRARAQGRVIPAVQQQMQQRQEVRQQGQNHDAMTGAIASWEQKWSSSDPDYNVKKDRVLDRLELTLARAARTNTLPRTAEQAVALAEKVRKEVETELRQNRPRKPVSTVDGGNANSAHLPEPKDTKDVIRRTLNK
jgi:hypothetical protein